MFGCFITLLGVSFALALRERMNYLMASCTNKTFIVIYIRQNPGEIKSSNSIWSWNFAEGNRTCTVVINIEIKPSEDMSLVQFLWSWIVYAIRGFSTNIYYCNLINIIDFAECSERHSLVYKILDFLVDILKLFSKESMSLFII